MLPHQCVQYTDGLLSRSLCLLRVKFADRVENILVAQHNQRLSLFDHLLQFENFGVRACSEKTENKPNEGSRDTQVTTQLFQG